MCNEQSQRRKEKKRRNSCLRLRPRPVFGSFGIVLMSCKVNFHIVRSALQILVIELLPIKSHIMALVPIHSLQWKPMIILKVRSGQNHDNKNTPQANFNPTAANIMDLLCIFVIIKHYFFQPVSELLLASTNYFCYIYTNNFFIHTTSYFSVVLRIIFLMCIENYFSRYREIIFWPKCVAGLAVEGDLFECLTSLATILKTVQAEECFQRECQGETFSGKETKEVFIFSYKI